MRRLLPLMMLTMCAMTARAAPGAASDPTPPVVSQAATAAQAPAPPPATGAGPDIAASAANGTSPSHPGRTKWEERFSQANLAHDGHLTLEEAKGGYRTIAKHFQEIDTDGKGYVTEDDIRAWHALQRASHARPAHSDDPLRPRNAYHTTASQDAHPLNTGTTQTVTIPAPESPARPNDAGTH
jgi:hypothetical protein